MARSEFAFGYRFRVRYSEVDPQAVVFNSRYLEYADFAVVEFWRAMDFEPQEAGDFHVGTATVRYVSPLRLDEEVDALVRIDRVGTASMVYRIELHGAGADDLRAAIELIYVHVDLATGKSTPIPEAFRARVTALP